MPRCSTTFFTTVEMVEGEELLGGTTVVGAMVVELMVVLVVMATIFSTTFSTTSFTILLSPAVMLMAGPARAVLFTVVFTTVR